MMVSGKLKYCLLLFVFLVSAGQSFSMDIRIGVFHDQLVNAFLFTSGEGRDQAKGFPVYQGPFGPLAQVHEPNFFSA
jgi:hypothetical protein